MSKADQKSSQGPEEWKAEGVLESTRKEFAIVTDGPSQGSLWVESHKIAILLRGLNDQDELIDRLKPDAQELTGLRNKIDLANRTIEELQQQLIQEKISNSRVNDLVLKAAAQITQKTIEKPE